VKFYEREIAIDLFLIVVTLITSSWIPGSPTADDTVLVTAKNFFENSTTVLMPTIITWIIFDGLFHVGFMVI